jgi:Tfp pilus assembly protein FimT
MKCCKSEEGDTIAELMIVLACGAIILTLAAPGLEIIQREWALWGGAHMVESSLFWGRMHAISSNGPLRFEVDPDGRSFHWEDAESGEKLDQSVWVMPGTARITSMPRRSVRFYPKGNAAPAGTFVIENAAGKYKVVVAITGRIRIERN